jgi:hypothetical protein
MVETTVTGPGGGMNLKFSMRIMGGTAGALLLLSGLPALAGSSSESASSDDVQRPKLHQITGRVTKSPKLFSNSLEVLDPSTHRVMVVKIKKKTAIFENGRATRDIPQGSDVRVTYELEGNQPVAQRVDVYPTGEGNIPKEGGGSKSH